MIRHSRLTTLGIVLCLLAALFAVEAKIAWFSPAGSAVSQLSAAKARPAEQPKMLPVRLAWPDGLGNDFSGTTALLASVLLASAAILLVDGILPDRIAAIASPGLDPAVFFRPPPAL